MSQAAANSFGDAIGARIQAEHRLLSLRWLDRLQSFLPVEAAEVFPSTSLLDHIPALLNEIGGYLRAPEQEEIAANTSVIEKARELGLLRHAQKASVHQLLREYDLLARILDTFIAEQQTSIDPLPTSPGEVAEVVSRSNAAVRILMQTTVDTFLGEYTATIAAQTERLESFNRMVSHELRNPLATIEYALGVMQASDPAETPAAARLISVIERSVTRMTELIRKLDVLSRSGSGDSPLVQRIEVAAVAREAARQLRDMADGRGVEIRIDGDLPAVTLEVARLELVFLNLLSNAIKYTDLTKPDRFVDVRPGPSPDGDGAVCVLVTDNGIGIPHEAQDAIFERFFRAHTDRDQELGVDGVGLGLAIARECMNALGGSLSVESAVGTGTTFTLVLPESPNSTTRT